MPKTIIETSVAAVLDQHDLFLIDAYGVLMTSAGPLPGAADFLLSITERGKDYFIVTNDASRTPESCVTAYKARGLSVPVEKVLSAGRAIIETFNKENLRGAKTAVLGTDDTRECVRRAGGAIVPITDDADLDVLVIGDDSGFDFLPTMNALLSSIHKLAKKNKSPRLLLANPDLLYPRGGDSFGFTSGSLAKFLAIGLTDLNPAKTFDFEVLGKPSRLLFDLARNQVECPSERTIMLGDQLHTDILGANRAGIHSALLTTGIAQLPLAVDLADDQRPTFLLRSLIA